MTELLEHEVKHLAELREIGAECCVLLVRNGDFPLTEPCEIALYGNGVRHTVKGGTGSGEVNSHTFINIEEGLEKAGFTITTREWLDQYEASVETANARFMEDIKLEAKRLRKNPIMMAMGAVRLEHDYDLPLDGNGETALYILSRISGEGNDRKNEKGDFQLTDTEVRDIRELNEKHAKFMLLINAGGPVDLSPVSDVKNIMVMSQLGAETGNIIADILLGKSYPSGKLTTTWSRYEDYPHVGTFGDDTVTLYKEGIYVGYKYFNSVGKKPMYPFGFGLGYTDFTVEPLRMAVNGENVCVQAAVTNTGDFRGREVAEVYVSEPQGKLGKAYQKLAGFIKTAELNPGEKETVAVEFRMSDIASYDESRQCYVLEKGDYIIRVGNSSDNTSVAGKIVLQEDIIVRKAQNKMGEPGFADFRPQLQDEIIETDKVFAVRQQDIICRTVNYDIEEETDPLVEGFSDEELAMANVGQFSGGLGALSIVGNAAKEVAGAAGQSTDILKKKGIPSLIMADGPAGIRLNREYIKTKKGAKGLSSGLPQTMMEVMPKPVKWILTPKNNVRNKTVYYQYASALPIGTAIAQSWNIKAAEQCGDIVGREMQMFGVDLWLAPALNIHRNVLCGRNFEYFSEDPLLSGMIAAALTNGVQKNEGCGVTIKHFAANNQETDRYDSDSRVSERALREVYLRTFEICLQNSDPVALMTSYNLINGEHTCQNYALIHDILRAEYGYSGYVMTDWLVRLMMNNSKNKKVNAGLIARASGDIVMPGSRTDYNEIISMIKNGNLSRSRLRKNVTRLYRTARRLDKC